MAADKNGFLEKIRDFLFFLSGSPTPSSSSDDRRSETSSAFRGANVGSDFAAAEAEHRASEFGDRSEDKSKADEAEREAEFESQEAEVDDNEMKNEALNGEKIISTCNYYLNLLKFQHLWKNEEPSVLGGSTGPG